ncbi:hypothetical protein Leryth_009981 [Lithospermum erythrorhizon]|uniref:DNA-binding transcription factor n=1 Tax=Lithospermum erythrorhizon TaxID=34254 RepID=A0AAV3RBS1_LITER|nr:hypothetical protein Leryth_009981 [Lithospermum erythrorhizon]
MAMDHQESNNNNIGSTSKKECNEFEINGVIKPPRRRKNPDAMPRKRTGKKDRHSKICTAQGVRDRRMRLSLPIARKFFDLQDMLGFDKASKTIEWLFSKSRKAIKNLLINQSLPPSKHSYLNGDYEYVNDDDDDDGDDDDDDDDEREEINEFVIPGDSNNNEARNEMITYEKEEVSKSRKVMNNYKNAKESREKARERARERTVEKMKLKRSKLWYDSNLANHNNLDQPFLYNNFHDSQKGEFHEGHAHHTIGHLYENLGNFDGNNLRQMDIHQTFNFENNDEMIVPHEIDCSYTNNGLMGIIGNWDANGYRMNPSNIGATSNMISVSGNNLTSFWCLPSSRTFPFSLQ